MCVRVYVCVCEGERERERDVCNRLTRSHLFLSAKPLGPTTLPSRDPHDHAAHSNISPSDFPTCRRKELREFFESDGAFRHLGDPSQTKPPITLLHHSPSLLSFITFLDYSP